MNRIDRLFATLLLLQHQSPVRAQDLADKFEISKRTVYRDIVALSEMGVPIVSLPGEGYELMAGFYLPPLLLTAGEAAALFLGAKMLTQQAAGKLPEDAENALAKIAAVLPQSSRQQVEQWTEIIGFIAPPQRFNLDDPKLLTCQQAILERRVIWLRYYGYNRSEITDREVEPEQLYYSEGAWYLEAYCRLRQAPRAFRLERIETLELRSENFTTRRAEPPTADRIDVAVRFQIQVARWVRERQHYAFCREEPATVEGVVMHYRLHRLAEIQSWLLGWGAQAEVLSPPELRRKIRQEAQRLLDMLT